jgi:Tfp pilus assembly protein PilF
VSFAICAQGQASYWKNSMTLFSHALNVTTNNYVAHFNLAADFRTRGKLDWAIEQYKKTLQIMPDHVDAFLGLGSAYGDQGNIPEAMRCFQQALLLKSDSAPAHNDLGLALEKQGKFDEALAQFKQAIQINPDYALGCNNLASLIATHPDIKGRDVNEAIDLAEHACSLTNYKNPAFLDTLAAAYAAAGRFAEAIDTAKKAANLAEAANQPELKKAIERHLGVYMQGKAISDSNKP